MPHTTSTARSVHEWVLAALSPTHRLTERTVIASVPHALRHEVLPTLEALVDTGHVRAEGAKTRRTYILTTKENS